MDVFNCVDDDCNFETGHDLSETWITIVQYCILINILHIR